MLVNIINDVARIHGTGQAAKDKAAELVKAALDNNAYVGDADGDGFTALHYAAFYRYFEAFKVLLDYGADPNAVDRYERTIFTLLNGDKFSIEMINRALDSPQLGTAHPEDPEEEDISSPTL